MLNEERRSRAELETASNAKDRSIAILSHELRAPVHAILGWTKLLRQTDIGLDARDRGLAVIERNALSQAELVETLLDLSRIASNKMTLSQTPVDFADVVSMAVDTLRPEACRKRIALSSEIHRNVPVVGDALRLQQVAMNLVGNALRYTQPGGWVGVRVERRPEAKAQLVVTDSGRGVSADLMPRIFDCFQQGEEHPGQGLGLGLYLVRKFVEMHGGRVWAESGGENRGATFTVLLPSDGAHGVVERAIV
jgi:signal transduction histidine kinase